MRGQQAIAIIETCGIPAALVLADRLEKAAAVNILGIENVAAGRVSIMIEGQAGAVKAALSVASATADIHPGVTVLGHHIIPNAEGFTNIRPLLSRHRLKSSLEDDVTWLDD